jgi:hypothetical protein
MEGWKTIYWFEEGQKSMVLKFYRQPILFPNFEIRGSETSLGKIGFVRKNGDGSFDNSIRKKVFRRKKLKVAKPKAGETITLHASQELAFKINSIVTFNLTL